MADDDLAKRMSELDDVELVRLLVIDPERTAPEVLAAARAEADRRGVPVDPAFIPPVEEEVVTGEEEQREAEAARFEAGGREVFCPHCGRDVFESKEVLLNTRGLTFFKLDWLNRSATALVCVKCGLVQIFAAPLQSSPPKE